VKETRSGLDGDAIVTVCSARLHGPHSYKKVLKDAALPMNTFRKAVVRHA